MSSLTITNMMHKLNYYLTILLQLANAKLRNSVVQRSNMQYGCQAT